MNVKQEGKSNMSTNVVQQVSCSQVFLGMYCKSEKLFISYALLEIKYLCTAIKFYQMEYARIPNIRGITTAAVKYLNVSCGQGIQVSLLQVLELG